MYATLLTQNLQSYLSCEHPVNVDDGNEMHKFVTRLVNTTRQQNHVLYYVKKSHNTYSVYIQSDAPIHESPEMTKAGFMLVKSINLDDKVKHASDIRFVVKVFPYKCTQKKRLYLQDAQARKDWMLRKLVEGGMDVHMLHEVLNEKQYFTKDKTVTHNAVTFTGTATVTDITAFQTMVRNGIGKLKNYGLGMFMF